MSDSSSRQISLLSAEHSHPDSLLDAPPADFVSHSPLNEHDFVDHLHHHTATQAASTLPRSSSSSSTSRSKSQARSHIQDAHYLPLNGDEQEERAEDGSPPKRCTCCYGGGCRMSKKKYIAFLSSICALSTLLIFIILLYAIVPVLIKNAVHKSNLSFSSIKITQPAGSSVTLSASGLISNTGPFQAKIDSMTLSVAQTLADGTDMYIGQLTMESLTISGSQTTIDIDTLFQVDDLAAFNSFVKTAIFESNVTWRMQSSAVVTPTVLGIQLPAYHHIPFDKSITLDGCSGLTHVTLEVFSLSNSTATDINLGMITKINNPSPFNIIPIGDLHFGVVYQNSIMGYITSTNASMYHGDNILQFTGKLKPDNLTASEELINRFLKGLDTNVTAVALANASSIPIYNAGLEGLTLNTLVTGFKQELVGQVTVTQTALLPSLTNEDVHFTALLDINVNSPLGPHSPLNINQVQMDVNITSQTTGLLVGQLSSPFAPVTPVFSPASPNFTLTFQANISQALLQITDPVGYASFVREFIQHDLLALNFIGTVNVHAQYALGKIEVTQLPLNISVQIAGLSGLQGAHETSLQIFGNKPCEHQNNKNKELQTSSSSYLPFPSCGILVSFSAYAHNPSNTSVFLPDAYFDIFEEVHHLGGLFANLSLVPGNNSITANGFLLPGSTAAEQQVMNEFLERYIKGIPRNISLVGNSQASSALVLQPADAKDLTLDNIRVNVTCHGMLLDLLTNFSTPSFDIHFINDQPDVLYISALVEATISLPDTWNLPLQVLSTSLNATIEVMDPLIGGFRPIGLLYIPMTAVYDQGGVPHRVQINITGYQFPVADVHAFEIFSKQLLTLPAANFQIDAYANPVIYTGVGVLNFSQIHSNHSVSLLGFNQFSSPVDGSPLLKIVQLDLVAAHVGTGGLDDPSTVTIVCTATLLNPSPVHVFNMQNVTLDMYYQNYFLSRIEIPNFQLGPAENTYPCGGQYIVPSVNDTVGTAIGQDFLSRYLNGQITPVTLKGNLIQPNGSYVPGTEIELLKPAFRDFATTVEIPGLTHQLLINITIDITWPELLTILTKKEGQVNVTVYLLNPFDVEMAIHNANFTLLATKIDAKTPVGFWVQDFQSNPLVVPAHSSIQSPSLPIELLFDKPAVEAIIELLFGPIGGTVTGNFLGTIGGINGVPQQLFGNFVNVPTRCRWS